MAKNFNSNQIVTHAIEDTFSLKEVIVSAMGDQKIKEVAEWAKLRLELVNTGTANLVYKAINGEGQVVAIFKGDAASKPLLLTFIEWDVFTLSRQMEKNGLARRSLVVSDIDQKMGLDLIPVTVNAEGDNGAKGTLQKFLDGYTAAKDALVDPERAVSVEKISKPQGQKAILFDTLLGMGDRHNGNWMVNSEGDLKLIDSDMVLFLRPSIRWYFPGSLHSLPQAQGVVAAEVKDSFLKLKPSDLEQILKGRDIPPKAIHYATQRLLNIQAALRRGDPIEKIARDNTIQSVINYKRGVAAIAGSSAAAILWNITGVDKAENIESLTPSSGPQ